MDCTFNNNPERVPPTYFTSRHHKWKRHIMYKGIICIFCAIFTLWSPRILHKHIVLWFSHWFYWNLVILQVCDAYLYTITSNDYVKSFQRVHSQLEYQKGVSN
jgi:hypothetical protein